MKLHAQRWLVKAQGGYPVPWTEVLSTRRDMYEISVDEAKRRIAAMSMSAPVDMTDAPAFVDRGESSGETDTGGDTTPPTADQILAIEDKSALEDIGRTFGLELDKRKSVKTLQAELIDHLGQ